MNKPIGRSVSVVLFIVTNAFNGVAQQPTSGKSVPSLSSDGVMTRRSTSPAVVGWTRFSPEGFGLSFELPGEPLERSYPVPPELQSQILGSKVFDYMEEGLFVSVAHIVFLKRTDLKSIAEEMRRSLYHSDSFQNLKISLVPKGDRVLMRGSFLRFGSEVEMRGFFVGSGEEVWFISVQTPRAKPEAASVCSRILESVTISR
jgi:hypothetical protein